MCTGAWLRATFAIIRRSSSIGADSPSNGLASRAASLLPGSFSALDTSLRSDCNSTGLDTKSKAPSFSARTAVSTLPCAVMTATGVGSSVPASMPRVRGRRRRAGACRSGTAGSHCLPGVPCAGEVTAGVRVDLHAVQCHRQQFAQVRLVVYHQGERALSCASLPPFRVGEHDAEYAAAAVTRLEGQGGPVAFAEFPRDEQAEAGAAEPGRWQRARTGAHASRHRSPGRGPRTPRTGGRCQQQPKRMSTMGRRRRRRVARRFRTGSSTPGAGGSGRCAHPVRVLRCRVVKRSAGSSQVDANSATKSRIHAASAMDSGRVASRRDNCITFSTISLTRCECRLIISSRRRSSGRWWATRPAVGRRG